MTQQSYIPGRTHQIETLKEKFDSLLSFISSRGGWIISVPGDAEVRIECLPQSPVPDELRELGHKLREIEPRERIIPHGITVRYIVGDDGEPTIATEGSTRPVQIVTQAGIVSVRRYEFGMELVVKPGVMAQTPQLAKRP